MSHDTPVSKILVLDDDPGCAVAVKQFCDVYHLIALKVRPGSAMAVLRTNIDLGGILLAENYGGSTEAALALVEAIHSARPELPIFIRRLTHATLDDLPDRVRQALTAAYVIEDMAALGKVVDEYIFSLIYPNAFLRGIGEIMQSVLNSQLTAASTVSMETPYIVHDRLIFGELLSLIPLESTWCRGYMMLQGEEATLSEFIALDDSRAADENFRSVNDLLSETTNMIWGAFKNRYVGHGVPTVDRNASGQVQIPLIVNHAHKYISFGTQNPQLCFRLNLRHEISGRTSILHARFVFNLSWTPEDFKEFMPDEAELAGSSELELF
jgi:hypothetical protein